MVLNLPHRVASGRDDFLVSESNAAAVALVDSWPQWPTPSALLVGPPGSGKSHLAEVWRRNANAATISSIAAGSVDELRPGAALVVEDLPGEALDEKALFHLLNHAREVKAHVLLTAREHPQNWGIELPDLASRLNALPIAMIGLADDALLRGVLLKLFADRQISVDESLLSYMISHMPRSLETARHAVGEIDRMALEQRAEVSRSFVARTLTQVLGSAQLNLFIE